MILVMDAGQVIEQGRHRDLVAGDGLYAKLVEAQIDVGALPVGTALTGSPVAPAGSETGE
jgi:hypothetical protein